MKAIAVLDYATGTVDIITDLPDTLQQDDDQIRAFLVADLNYNDNEISWMELESLDNIVYLKPTDFGSYEDVNL